MGDAMTSLHAFRAIRYRLDKSRDLSDCICPPYDIISEERQAELHARSERNFVRIELARADGDRRYTKAADTLRRWLREGILVRERAPALYLLEQEFHAGGRTWRRRGVFGLIPLPSEDRASILSHEGTLAAPKADRLHLMRACRAMTSPIMLMAEDSDRTLMELLGAIRGEPDAVAEDAAGVVNRLWVIAEGGTSGAIARAVAGGPLFIADGHHRFETALTYRNEMQAACPGAPLEAGFNYALALVTSARDEGLQILPTHRLLAGLDRDGLAGLWACIEQRFAVEPVPPEGDGASDLSWLDAPGAPEPIFAIYCRGMGLHRLVAKASALADVARVVDRLDVSVLHRGLIEPMLASEPGRGPTPCADGVSHDSHAAGPAARGPRLSYTTDASQAIAAVDRGDYDAAFLLRPTRVAEVMAAARAGERMPGKSTYFYPKIPAGLVVSDASEEPI